MDESSSQDPKKDEASQSVDLSELKSFSFGTQWAESPKSARPAGKPRPGRGAPMRGDRPDRRQGGPPAARKDRRPPRAERSGAPVGDSADNREEGGRRPFRSRQPASPPRPYESAVFDVCFYPEDNCFTAIIKAMRANHLTYELFHVAKLFLEKPDRFIASITRKAEKGQKPEKALVCAADNMPFPSEEEAIAHAMAYHAETYFEVEEIEVEPPSGNFTFVNRCPFTKELLGPPNYHKYEQTLRNHHQARLPNMPFEKLQGSIETVRDEEAIKLWLDSQRKATRYTTKPAEGEEPRSFDSYEDALGYLRTEGRSRVIKQVNYARVHGVELEKYRETEAYRAVEGERQRQLRFPLDTANAIRGRMRREKFSIYKKGAKGVTYVCATKRNFRTPGQVMAPDLDRIIRFLEKQPTVKAKEFAPAFAEWLSGEEPDFSVDEKKALRDLHWLIADGYVTHFEDDSLVAQPVLEAGSSKSDQDENSEPRTKGASKKQPSANVQPATPDAQSSAIEGTAASAATSSDSEAQNAAAGSDGDSEANVSPEAEAVEPVPTVESAGESADPPTDAVEVSDPGEGEKNAPASEAEPQSDGALEDRKEEDDTASVTVGSERPEAKDRDPDDQPKSSETER